MYLALILLVGCGYRLGTPQVSWGEADPVPIVQPSNDGRRWYVPVESETAGSWIFFVDTGYSYTTCDDDLVERLGLPTRGKVRVRGELGHIKGTKARLPPLTFGGHRVEGLVCQVRDLDSTSSIRDPLEVPVAGVLGIDVLRRFYTVFDAENAVVMLFDPRRTADLSDDEPGVVPLRRERFGTRARVPLQVEDVVVWPIIDTGASETYLDAARLGWEADWQQENVTIRGTGARGSAVRTLSYFDLHVQLAGEELGQITVTGRERPPGAPGLVGLDILGRFRQEYDFRRRRARFTPVERGAIPSWETWSQAPPPRLEPIRLHALERPSGEPRRSSAADRE